MFTKNIVTMQTILGVVYTDSFLQQQQKKFKLSTGWVTATFDAIELNFKIRWAAQHSNFDLINASVMVEK